MDIYHLPFPYPEQYYYLWDIFRATTADVSHYVLSNLFDTAKTSRTSVHFPPAFRDPSILGLITPALRGIPTARLALNLQSLICISSRVNWGGMITNPLHRGNYVIANSYGETDSSRTASYRDWDWALWCIDVYQYSVQNTRNQYGLMFNEIYLIVWLDTITNKAYAFEIIWCRNAQHVLLANPSRSTGSTTKTRARFWNHLLRSCHQSLSHDCVLLEIRVLSYQVYIIYFQNERTI